MLRAVYVRHAARREEALADRAVSPLVDRPPDLRVFASDAPTLCFPYAAESLGHQLLPHEPETFEAIAVQRSVPLFSCRWTRAFLRHLYRALVPGGTLRVPVTPAPKAGEKGLFSLAELRSLFGRRAVSLLDDPAYAEVKRTRKEPLPAPSVLEWYYRDYARLALNDLTAREGLSAASVDVLHQLAGAFLTADSSWVRPAAKRGRGPTEIAQVAKKHAYWVGSLPAKTTVLKRVVRDHLPRRRSLAWLDHGGGFGLIAAELLLDPDLALGSALCCDPSGLHVLFARQLYNHFRESLRGRFAFHLGAAQDFDYTSSYDVITFVGSLLYVPREATEPTLDAAWEALRPGGVLVVHENVRTARAEGSPDYDRMFPKDELDSRLARYGSIARYASTAAVKLRPDQAGDKTVFRAVQKPDD